MKDHSLPENDNGENFECAQYFADANRTPPMPPEPIPGDPDPVLTGLRIGNAIAAAVGPKGGTR